VPKTWAVGFRGTRPSLKRFTFVPGHLSVVPSVVGGCEWRGSKTRLKGGDDGGTSTGSGRLGGGAVIKPHGRQADGRRRLASFGWLVSRLDFRYRGKQQKTRTGGGASWTS